MRFNTILVMATISSSSDTAALNSVLQLLLSTYCREVDCLQLESELTDLILAAMQGPVYVLSLLRVQKSPELGLPWVAAAAALSYLGVPPRRRHMV
jgi:hypothetical protein